MMIISYNLFNIVFFLLTYLSHYVSSQGTVDDKGQGRIFSGCALLESNIYCYGGFHGSSFKSGTDFQYKLNEHIMLNLDSFNNFTDFDKTKIQWKKKSNMLNADTPLAAAGYIKATTLSDHSILFYGGQEPSTYYNPFVHYNPQLDAWTNLTIPNNTNYTIGAPIVNIGDDKIWIWGGVPWPNNYGPSDLTFLYDYKTNTWPVVKSVTGTVLVDHTATLVNHLIYNIGGFYTSVHMNNFEDNPFNVFKTYNTIDGTWTNITTNGVIPQPRNFHTTVLTDDKKYLLIYGGFQPVEGKARLTNDVYYVYDINENYLKLVDIPTHSQVSHTTRYGHYATIYNSNYLLLVFGYSDLNTAAESLNVLDVHDPYSPTWLSAPNITIISNQPAERESVNIKTIIPAVVVSVVVVLTAIAVGLFFFIRHRKRKQKNAFILEQEDPRHVMEGKEFGDATTEGTTAIHSNDSQSQVRNSLIVNLNNNNNNSIKPFEG